MMDNQKLYVGFWYNGAHDGPGILYKHADGGHVEQGVWENGDIEIFEDVTDFTTY